MERKLKQARSRMRQNLTLTLLGSVMLCLGVITSAWAQQPEGAADMGQALGLAPTSSPTVAPPSVAQQLNEAFAQVEALKQVGAKADLRLKLASALVN